MKLGTYIPINVDNKCWNLSADRKFKMVAIEGERVHNYILYGKYIFIIILLRTALHNSPGLSRDDNTKVVHLW